MTFVKTTLFHKAGEGSGGGDQHNLGWYATQSALEEAHPTAEAGDYAIVGSTDTVWVWDTDNSAWVDSDQKGQVTSVNGQTGAVTVSEVPSQTGNAGKFLTTDGTDATWSNSVSELNISSTNLYHLKIEKITALSFGLSFYTYDNVTGQLYYNVNNHQWVLKGPYSNYFIFDEIYTCLRTSSAGGTLGNSSVKWDSIYVTKINNGSDITIPTTGGRIAVQVSSMPTASSTLEGEIYQFIGTTDANYTHGYIYECVSDGGNPATYSWSALSVQASSGGLPSQTGNSGKFLTTDGTDASWSDKPLVNTATAADSVSVLGNASSQGSGNINIGSGSSSAWAGVAVGMSANATLGSAPIAIGMSSRSTGYGSVAVGMQAVSTGRASIQLGEGTNSTNGTLKVGSYYNGTSVNYELMSADGTIPTDRLTKVNSTITLTSAGWSSNTQTVNVTGMTATGVVFVSPDPTDQSAYTSAGILCTAQGSGTLTFTCTNTPSGDIDVNVVML